MGVREGEDKKGIWGVHIGAKGFLSSWSSGALPSWMSETDVGDLRIGV